MANVDKLQHMNNVAVDTRIESKQIILDAPVVVAERPQHSCKL